MADTVLPQIHPTAFIAAGAAVMGSVTLAEESSVWYGCVLRGDMAPISIGPQTNVQDLTMIHVDADAPCRIGARVGIGHRAILHGCTVEDGCLIGMGSIILSHAVIGAGSVIGANALVTEGMIVPPGSLVMGTPGRVVRPVDPALAGRIAHTWRHYVEQARVHRRGQYPLAAPTV